MPHKLDFGKLLHCAADNRLLQSVYMGGLECVCLRNGFVLLPIAPVHTLNNNQTGVLSRYRLSAGTRRPIKCKHFEYTIHLLLQRNTDFKYT